MHPNENITDSVGWKPLLQHIHSEEMVTEFAITKYLRYLSYTQYNMEIKYFTIHSKHNVIQCHTFP